MNQLSIIERAVAELLPIGGARKINITDITKLVDLDRREVYAVIQSLRSKGVPIVATRGKEGGIFVATNESERLPTRPTSAENAAYDYRRNDPQY